jgi:hypothetical protein
MISSSRHEFLLRKVTQIDLRRLTIAQGVELGTPARAEISWWRRVDTAPLTRHTLLTKVRADHPG